MNGKEFDEYEDIDEMNNSDPVKDETELEDSDLESPNDKNYDEAGSIEEHQAEEVTAPGLQDEVSAAEENIGDTEESDTYFRADDSDIENVNTLLKSDDLPDTDYGVDDLQDEDFLGGDEKASDDFGSGNDFDIDEDFADDLDTEFSLGRAELDDFDEKPARKKAAVKKPAGTRTRKTSGTGTKKKKKAAKPVESDSTDDLMDEPLNSDQRSSKEEARKSASRSNKDGTRKSASRSNKEESRKTASRSRTKSVKRDDTAKRQTTRRRSDPAEDYDEDYTRDTYDDEMFDDEPYDYNTSEAYDEEYVDDEPLDGDYPDTPRKRRQSQPQGGHRRSGSLKKASGVDDFREWISDNLRYIMLGGIVLLIIIAVIVAFRGCGKGKGDGDVVPTPDESTTVVEDPGETQEVVEEEVIANPLVAAESGIVSLVNERFAALAAGNIDSVRSLQTDLSAVDEARIASESQTVESYLAKDVYTKTGMSDGTYVAYVSYDTKYIDYATAVPMLEELYIIQTGDGGFLVDSDAQTDPDIVSYMDQLRQDSDAQKLIADVQAAHNAALASDGDLSAFLSGMGEAVSAPIGAEPGDVSVDETQADDGPRMTASDDINLRSEPGGDVIGGVPSGASVRVLGTAGENNDWYEIEYDGVTGYVYSEYLY